MSTAPSPSVEVLPPSVGWEVARRLRARHVPEPIVEVTRVLVESMSPAPSPDDVLRQFAAPAARQVREAYRAGERDRGRLGFLLARYVFGMPVESAWIAVPRVAQVLGPGAVDPAFLAEAQGHAHAAYGALAAATPDSTTPWVVGGLGVVCLGLLVWVFDIPGATKRAIRRFDA